MTVDLVALAISSNAPRELARFWARALRWELHEVAPDHVELLPTDATSFRLEFRSGATAKTGQNPIHLDLTSSSLDDQHESVAELVANGARLADVGQVGDEGHVVLADPEGNELCIIGPGNRFLASCPRLGAVNCDGTSALGRFFSAILGWPLVWDENEETAIQSPSGSGPKITWSGPPLMPKSNLERMHFHVVAATGSSDDLALEHLLGRGAAVVAGGDGCGGAIAIADVDGNKLCLVRSSTG